MSLAPGTRLGAYEILSPLGAGGMGEVYRARDTRLNRDVAIKVLPEAFVHDADRLARFRREAQVLASLNHPHIAAIYGIEDTASGSALILELVEGPTLADRLAHGPIPVDEALPIARQIAEALEAAHENGVVHRDLKPANIKLTPDGKVKVLDFGLAKALDHGPAEAGHYVPNASMSPTITSPAMTMGGAILGTAAYMSPEQAKGKPVDKRSDIWAFGCVLFEMLTGKRPFAGEDVTDSIAFVITKDPDWKTLPASMSPALTSHLRRCLEKDRRNRIHDIADMRLALDGAFDVPAAAAIARPQSRSLLAAGAVALAAAGVLAGWFARPPVEENTAPVRSFIVTPSPAQLSRAITNRDFAISPDGKTLAYFATLAGRRQLYVRSLDALYGTPLRDVERGFEPFFSPDSRWVGYNDETNFTLRKIAVAGGPPIPIARVGREILGAAWAADDSIIYSTSEPGSGLWRVRANASKPEPVTRIDAARGELFHGWPQVVPGGRGIVYSIRTDTGFQIGAVDLSTSTTRVLLPSGTAPRFVPPNYLVYGVDDALFAVTLDPARLEIVGQPVAMTRGVIPKPNGSMDFDVSTDGTLVYATGSAAVNQRRLFWVDRTGKAEPLSTPPRRYVSARLSPDSSRVALEARDQAISVAIWDINRGVMTPLSSAAQLEITPTWTRDGLRVVLAASLESARNLVMRSADGTGTIDRVTSSHNDQAVDDVSPNGSTIVFSELMAETAVDLMMVPTDTPRKVVPLLQTKYSERNGVFSADGKLIAYQSDESGTQEVWVRPFPEVTRARLQVSTSGGIQPVWSGRELLYVTPDGWMMSAAIAAEPTLRATAPTRVVSVQPYHFGLTSRAYDITRDGKRFLMIEKGAEGDGIVVVLNWLEELRRKVPN